MESVAQKITDSFQKEDMFLAVIAMGSFGNNGKGLGIGSDLDLLCIVEPTITDETEIRSEIVKKIEEIWGADGVLKILHPDGKVVVYLRENCLKLDLGFSTDLKSKARFLRGSEGCKPLFDKKDFGPELDLLMKKRAFQVLNDYTMEYHQVRFLEMFELLCKSWARKDRYRVEFYQFILRHSLVVMECINRGEKEHLYVPKKAFEKQSDVACLKLINEDVGVFRDYISLYQQLAPEKDTEFFEAILSHYSIE